MKKTILDIIANLPSTGRMDSQKKVLLSLFERFDFNQILIVETGTIRNSNRAEDGWATLCWKIWSDFTQSKVFTVDKSNESLNSCKKVIGQNPNIFYIYSDSITFLKNLSESFKIDLLVLDSYDWAENEKEICANHQLQEIKAAEKNLTDKSFILIDDVFNLDEFDGKGKLAIPYLLNKKWRIINYADTQVLLSK